jgi:hypothetical protein
MTVVEDLVVGDLLSEDLYRRVTVVVIDAITAVAASYMNGVSS